MIFNFFVEINNELIDVNDIDKSFPDSHNEDWYYLTGSVEISSEESGKIYIDRTDRTDIVPFAYEFYSLFFSLIEVQGLISSMPYMLKNKICSSSIFYHPSIKELIFKDFNDVYFETMFMYREASHKNIVFKKEGFLNELKSGFYQFDKAIRLLFPKSEIGMLDELKKMTNT